MDWRGMWLWLIGAIAFGLAACGSDDNGAATPTPTGTPRPSATSTPTSTDDDIPERDGEFGAQLPSDAEAAQLTKCLPPPALAQRMGLSPTPPPTAAIPTDALPPVQSQGKIGSCEVWSSGYAMGSYAANLTNQQNISDLTNTVSPGFVYPWVLNQEGMQQNPPTKVCPDGTAAPTTLNYLVMNSAPSLALIQYEASCMYLNSVNINQTFSTDLSIGHWCTFAEADSTAALTALKGWIAQGYVVQTSIMVPWEFPQFRGSGVFDVPATCPSPAPTPSTTTCTEKTTANGSFACVASTTTSSGCAQHGITIVGYDDDMTGPDGSAGAVLIMNSFGTQWGDAGFMWMSYDGYEQIYLGSTLAFPPQPSGGIAAPFEVRDAFQWVEPQSEGLPRTHLIINAAFAEPIPDAEISITAPAESAVRQHSVQPFRHGYFYLTRRDGKQFPVGNYAVEIRGSDGRRGTAAVTIDLDATSDLPAASLPGDLTGSNGQPVERVP